ncbi:hypothetical protein FXO37_09985 [Capsicum annuum]|nr:hypothetical protein FXO37_09985 [Capsicum annuum]
MAFYEIMRKHRVRPVGFLPCATFGCSVATCASLLVYGDGIECVAKSLPAAPSIASLGRGIQTISFEVAEVEPCVTVKVALCDPEVTSRSRGCTFCRNVGCCLQQNPLLFLIWSSLSIFLLACHLRYSSQVYSLAVLFEYATFPVNDKVYNLAALFEYATFPVNDILWPDDLSAGFLRKQQCKKSFPSGDNVSGIGGAERKRKLGLPPEDPAFPKPSIAPVVEEKKDDDAKVKTAFNTLLTYAKNVATNPNEKKFRKIRLLVMLLFSDKFRKYYENLEIALAFARAYELSITIGGPQEMDNWYTSAKLLGLFKNVYGKSLPLQQLSSVWALGLP